VSLKEAEDVKSALSVTITEVGKVSFDGATGKVEFDEFGDTTNKTMTAYQVKGGEWVPVKTGT
jgi:branched-chain amino acid transport system substrate-binding protein